MERTRFPTVRNEASDEGRSGCGIERRRKKRASERIEITSATERVREIEGERERKRETAIRRTRDVGR